MVRLETISIEGEITSSKEKNIELFCEDNWEKASQQVYLGAFIQMENSQKKRRVELRKEIRQLRRLLDQPFLPEKLRDSIITRINELESSPLSEVHTGKFVVFEDGNHIMFLGPPHPGSALSERVFIAEYVEDNNFWAIPVSIRSQADFNHPMGLTERPTAIFDCPTVFNEDGLSHFQNCPVPPPLTANVCNCTRNRLGKLLANWCFVSITPYISESTLYVGDYAWKELKKSSRNASEFYRKLQITYLTNSLGYSANFLTTSKNTPRTREKPYRFCSTFRDASWNATTPRHLNSSFSYLFLLNSVDVRNKYFPYGGVN